MPPDIAVEVVSTSGQDRRRDRIEKLEEYARFGVRYYWLVDPEARTLEILELEPEGHFRHVAGLSDGRLENIPGCPGLVLELDDLWRETERLAPHD